nr:hypothetical protein Iba_chr15cCG6640 [Ipomoea batatas]
MIARRSGPLQKHGVAVLRLRLLLPWVASSGGSADSGGVSFLPCSSELPSSSAGFRPRRRRKDGEAVVRAQLDSSPDVFRAHSGVLPSSRQHVAAVRIHLGGSANSYGESRSATTTMEDLDSTGRPPSPSSTANNRQGRTKQSIAAAAAYLSRFSVCETTVKASSPPRRNGRIRRRAPSAANPVPLSPSLVRREPEEMNDGEVLPLFSGVSSGGRSTLSSSTFSTQQQLRPLPLSVSRGNDSSWRWKLTEVPFPFGQQRRWTRAVSSFPHE